jgi:hypothetical protein
MDESGHFTGPVWPFFPAREAIIPENEAIIFTMGRMLRLMGEAIAGNIGEAENRVKRDLVHCRGLAGDRRGAMTRIRGVGVLPRRILRILLILQALGPVGDRRSSKNPDKVI